jgi:hypothetical protein
MHAAAAAAIGLPEDGVRAADRPRPCGRYRSQRSFCTVQGRRANAGPGGVGQGWSATWGRAPSNRNRGTSHGQRKRGSGQEARPGVRTRTAGGTGAGGVRQRSDHAGAGDDRRGCGEHTRAEHAGRGRPGRRADGHAGGTGPLHRLRPGEQRLRRPRTGAGGAPPRRGEPSRCSRRSSATTSCRAASWRQI